MENLFGKITASLIDNDLSFPPELVDIINQNISPPEKVTADNIYIRAMYIVSDEVNSYGGRFPDDEFETVMNLIVDSPVLVGHRKDSLPIARNFHTEQKQKGNTNWIKVYFYWLKNAKGAETLKNNIDGGIYKECSISFTFSLPECSICGDDIRRCGHRPFKEYQTASGEKSTASFNYRKIDKVLETSIVYRGSVHDTTLTNELFSPDNDQLEIKGNTEKPALPTINRIWTSEILDPTHQYKIRPAYESIRVVVNNSDSGIVAQYCDNTIIDSQKLNKYLHKLSLPNGKYSLDCRLIGYRGKERQKLFELSKYLEGQKSKVTRLELRIYDLLSADNDSNELSDILVPSKIISKINLNETIKNFSTRYGVEITDCQTEKQYLLTNKKKVFLNIISKEQIAGGYKYGLSGRVSEADIKCTTSVTSRKNLQIGLSIEIECSSLRLIDKNIELSHPKLIDSAGKSAKNENIELLINSTISQNSRPTYIVSQCSNKDLLLTINKDSNKENYRIRNFSFDKLKQKSRFLAEEADIIKDQSNTQLGFGQILQSDCNGSSNILNLNGYFDGQFRFRPIVLNHTNRFLFYQVFNNQTGGDHRVTK
ncbi:MAG: hypothetical protein GY865_00875 [candidate division Zixibacteria bacterium]|nr:hypothetical protein [candidate division Zixibacteria bacterium]